jgi:tetratricopeptide (TPR) repeat protein
MGVELREALAIIQKLADENPAVTEFQSSLAHALGQDRNARAIYQKLVDDNPSVVSFRRGLAHEYYLKVAPLQAWLGQDKEFSSTCEQLLSLAKDTQDSMLADSAAKCCSLRQADPKRHEAALVLARRAVEHGKGSPWFDFFEMGLGMAEYRCGHFAEADTALTAAMNAATKHLTVSNTSAFYRAMSLFRQGKTDEARKLATEAAAKMKPLPLDEKNPLAGGAGHNELVMWLAYKEAKAMIPFDAAPPAKAENGKK